MARPMRVFWEKIASAEPWLVNGQRKLEIHMHTQLKWATKPEGV